VRKRLIVAAALATLTSLADEDGSTGTGRGALDGRLIGRRFDHAQTGGVASVV
jgi:hypothetical protein